MVADGKRIGEVLLQLKNITLSFGAVQALSDVSFEVLEHEILAIIGPNGAGKSSMLNVINGFYTANEGQIIYKGISRPKMEPAEVARDGVFGFVFRARLPHVYFALQRVFAPPRQRGVLTAVVDPETDQDLGHEHHQKSARAKGRGEVHPGASEGRHCCGRRPCGGVSQAACAFRKKAQTLGGRSPRGHGQEGRP